MALLPSNPDDQKKLLIGLVPLLILFGYWYFFHGANVEEVTERETRLENLERNNNTARVIASQGAVGELEQRLGLYREHIQRLEQLIPSGEEVPELLESIASSAQNTDVELALMRPEQDAAGDFYRRVTYEMGVIGEYHDIARFLTEVGSLPRIVTPIDLNLRARQEGSDLEASFRIETYVLPQDTMSAAGGAA